MSPGGRAPAFASGIGWDRRTFSVDALPPAHGLRLANARFHDGEDWNNSCPDTAREGAMSQRARVLFATLAMIAVTWFPFPIAA